jgi:L-alanine-DL-glutamate epimerase-like enolase superfamily enzyme
MGITGAMKVAHASEGLGLDVEIHGGGPAERHIMASIRNTNYYELGLVHPLAPSSGSQIYADGYNGDNLDSIDDNGHVPVPTGPGLGTTYDWDFIEKNRIGLKSFP